MEISPDFVTSQSYLSYLSHHCYLASSALFLFSRTTSSFQHLQKYLRQNSRHQVITKVIARLHGSIQPSPYIVINVKQHIRKLYVRTKVEFSPHLQCTVGIPLHHSHFSMAKAGLRSSALGSASWWRSIIATLRCRLNLATSANHFRLRKDRTLPIWLQLMRDSSQSDNISALSP